VSLHIAMDWTAEAACYGEDVAVFFPEPGQRGQPLDYRAAKMICAGCPVQLHCLSEFLREDDGCFGGYDPAERKRLRTKPGVRAGNCSGCGLPIVVTGNSAHYFCAPDCERDWRQGRLV
jgi:WhiB family transcriptional regulator, redox-sensing transcriptional regulator